MSEHIEQFDTEAEAIDPETGVTLDIKVSVKDMPSVMLLVTELDSLYSDMRVGASPFADRLGNALHRFGIDYDEEQEQPA